MPASTLITATPADGQRLARQLADALLSALPSTPATMPEMLRTGANGQTNPTVIAAVYFHAISLVNDGWRGSAGVTSSRPS